MVHRGEVWFFIAVAGLSVDQIFPALNKSTMTAGTAQYFHGSMSQDVTLLLSFDSRISSHEG